MIRLVVPGVTVLLFVAALVGASSWNRSSPPTQTLVVTERELSVERMRSGNVGDDPAVGMRLRIEYRNEPLDSKNWLSEDGLRALGFALEIPAGAPEAMETYQSTPPRLGWVVLEYDGPAFRDLHERRLLRQPAEGPPRFPAEPSRLVPVDAGPDFDPLRQRYSPQHFIVRAVFDLRYEGPSTGGPLVHGVLREVIPSRITVPRDLRPALDPPGSGFEAELASGPMGLVYLSALRKR